MYISVWIVVWLVYDFIEEEAAFGLLISDWISDVCSADLCDITQPHRGSRTGYIGHVMVLCHPKTFITNLFCFTSKIQAMPECIGRSTAFGNQGQVKNRKGDQC